MLGREWWTGKSEVDGLYMLFGLDYAIEKPLFVLYETDENKNESNNAIARRNRPLSIVRIGDLNCLKKWNNV